MSSSHSQTALHIGWAETDITPQELPVYLYGQFHIRVSEGIRDPLKSTVLALESSGEHVVFVSVDTAGISEDLRKAVTLQLNEPGLDSKNIIFHATHTHEAPHICLKFWNFDSGKEGIDVGFKPTANYVAFAAGRIAAAIAEAWRKRSPGGVAFGQDYAVVGRNRRWSDREGKATMYGLNEESAERFDHFEGYEDHSINVLTTYDAGGVLTGIVVNLPCPSQESEDLFEVSADFWHETRQELRARLGEQLYILPQCSAAGELTSHLLFDARPHQRMLALRGRTSRQEIAVRIADAVDRVLPYLPPAIDNAPVLKHQRQTLQLPLNQLSEADVEEARREAGEAWASYQAEKRKMLDNPELQKEPRWYVPLTEAYNRAEWHRGVAERYERNKVQPNSPAEVHVLRLGEIAFATNQFEYYLDFGIQIKVKSKALQTFIVQLAGHDSSYIPSRRAAKGGGYGAVPASNPIGHEGGQQLADFTVERIAELWAEV